MNLVHSQIEMEDAKLRMPGTNLRIEITTISSAITAAYGRLSFQLVHPTSYSQLMAPVTGTQITELKTQHKLHKPNQSD